MKLVDLVPWLFSRKQKPLVTLSIRWEGCRPQVVEIHSLPAVIGRSREADLCLTDNWVSKVHCCLDVVDGRLLVRDIESRHGTLVNGKRIRSCGLKVGDQVTIGITTIALVDIADSNCSVVVTAKPR